MRVAICAIIKNEGRYLKEWLSLHAAIGFDHFYLYDNESTDNTSSIISAAGPRWVTAYHWPRREGPDSPQIRAYQHCASVHGGECDWLLYLDGDELLNLKAHFDIKSFLAEYEDADAIGFYWRMFGDNGRTTYEPGLLMDRFTAAAPKDFHSNHLTKTIVRTKSLVKPYIHTHHIRDGGIFIDPERRSLQDVPDKRQDVVTHTVAQINHYFTKTIEEWRLKRARGKADLWAGHEDFYRPDAEFDVYNRNEESDETILIFRDATMLKMKEIFGDWRPLETCPDGIWVRLMWSNGVTGYGKRSAENSQWVIQRNDHWGVPINDRIEGQIEAWSPVPPGM